MNLEFYAIIWLGENLNEIDHEQIRSICNYLIEFHDEKQCFDYLQSKQRQWHRYLCVIQDRTNRQSDLISQIIDYKSILTVYIYSNENSTINHRKIKGIFNRFDELIQRLRIDQNEREFYQIDEILPWTIFNPISPNEQTVFIQLFLLCLISNNSNSTLSNFIDFCRDYYRTNPGELNLINEFQRDYSPEEARLWLTKKPTFLSRLLYQAFRTTNLEILINLNFFIRDLKQQLGIKNQSTTTTTSRVYRGQLISKDDLDLLIKSTGQYLSMNTFLSTNSNRQSIRNSLLSSTSSDQFERILFEINSTNDQQNLLQIGSIFRLVHIEKDLDNIWNIQLTLTSNKDHQLGEILKQKLTRFDFHYSDQLAIGFLLEEYQQFEQAEVFFQLMIKQSSNDEDTLARCDHALGEISLKQNQFDQSLQYFRKCLDKNDANLALTYNSLGVVYTKQAEYHLALEAFEKAIGILENYVDNEHLDLAMCFNNIGIVYQQVKNYSEALEYYHKSWNIRQKSLHSNDLRLGQSHICIGNIHYSLKHYDLAFEHFNSALEIFSQIYAGDQHRDIAIIYRNMALVYRKKTDLQQARFYFEKSANIFRKFLPMNQSDLNQIERLLQQL